MSPTQLTNLANKIGKKGFVVCRYEWDRTRQQFRWRFYRHRRFIGGTANENEVIRKVEKFVETK